MVGGAMSERVAVVISNPTVGAELGHLEPWLESNGFTVRRLFRDDILAADAADDADLVTGTGPFGPAEIRHLLEALGAEAAAHCSTAN